MAEQPPSALTHIHQELIRLTQAWALRRPFDAARAADLRRQAILLNHQHYLATISAYQRLALPAGSLILFGGGWKGFDGERIPRPLLVAMIADRLGLDEARILEGYSMTEINVFTVRCDRWPGLTCAASSPSLTRWPRPILASSPAATRYTWWTAPAPAASPGRLRSQPPRLPLRLGRGGDARRVRHPGSPAVPVGGGAPRARPGGRAAILAPRRVGRGRLPGSAPAEPARRHRSPRRLQHPAVGALRTGLRRHAARWHAGVEPAGRLEVRLSEIVWATVVTRFSTIVSPGK